MGVAPGTIPFCVCVNRFSPGSWVAPGILPNGYNPPEGFCWDQSCDDEPIMDDPDLEDYNVDDVVQRFTAADRKSVV